MRRSIVLVLLTSLASGCSFGMRAERFTPAQYPDGIQAHITTTDASLDGELIEVRDSGLVLLCDRIAIRPSATQAQNRRLRLIPYELMLAGRFDQTKLRIAKGIAPTAASVEQLRLLSRFPQGLSPAVLSALLEGHGQSGLAGVEP